MAIPLNPEADDSGIKILSPNDGEVLGTNTVNVNYQVTGNYDGYEGVVLQLDKTEAKDSDGNHVFENIDHGYHTLRIYPVNSNGDPIGPDAVSSFMIKTSGKLPKPIKLKAGDIALYDGEKNSVPILGDKCWGGEEVEDEVNGGKALLGKPSRWSAPGYVLYCGNDERRDLSPYEKIEFVFRNNGTHGKDDWTFTISTWNKKSKTVAIKNYIEGGVIDETWRQVIIPTNDLKTNEWDMNYAERLSFMADASGRQFIVDNIIMRYPRIINLMCLE